MGQAPRALTPHLSAQHLFGAELRHWRELRGLSQDELGSRVNFSGDYVSKVEKADRFPPAALAEECDAVLETGGVLGRMWPTVEHARAAYTATTRVQVGNAQPALSSTSVTPLRLPNTYWSEVLGGIPTAPSDRVPNSGEDEVRRRHFLSLSGSVLTAHLLELLDREPDRMRAALDSTSVGEPHLAHVEEAADLLGVRAVQLPPLQLLEPTLTHFRSVRAMLADRQSTAHQIRLVRSAGKLANVVGEILFNQGAFREARQWYSTAMHAALDMGDQYLADIALAGLSYLPTYAGEPQVVLRLTSARLDTARDNTPAVAWLWGMSARAHASLGDRDQFKRSIARARDTLDRSSEGSLHAGIFSFLPEKLAFYKANGYARLGEATKTADAARRALQLYDPRETTEPALVQLDHAAALALSGETDEACAVATKAITAENTFMGVTVSGRAREFNQMLDGGEGQAISDWREQLRISIGSQARVTIET